MYSCDIGFTLNGSAERKCADDGTGWSDTDPACGEFYNMPKFTKFTNREPLQCAILRKNVVVWNVVFLIMAFFSTPPFILSTTQQSVHKNDIMVVLLKCNVNSIVNDPEIGTTYTCKMIVFARYTCMILLKIVQVIKYRMKFHLAYTKLEQNAKPNAYQCTGCTIKITICISPKIGDSRF